MLVFENEQRLVRRIGIIEDAHERLAAVVDRVKNEPPFDTEHRTEANRVQGCISRVWLLCDHDGEVCHFRVDAESTLVRGLAALVCEVFTACPPVEIVAHDGDILEKLGLTAQLTHTRRIGLESLRRAIREFAAQSLRA